MNVVHPNDQTAQGLFDALVESQSVRATFCGHDHSSDVLAPGRTGGVYATKISQLSIWLVWKQRSVLLSNVSIDSCHCFTTMVHSQGPALSHAPRKCATCWGHLLARWAVPVLRPCPMSRFRWVTPVEDAESKPWTWVVSVHSFFLVPNCKLQHYDYL